MDWVSERYVRLCADAATWTALGFAGQTIVMHLLGAVDTQGAIWLGPAEPWELAAGLFGAPEDLARSGMQRALQLGVIERRLTYLILPRYRKAKMARTEAERKRDWRHRKRDQALRGQTSEESRIRDKSRNVTTTNGYHAIPTENTRLSQMSQGHVPRDIVTSIVAGQTIEAPYEDDPSQVKLPAPSVATQLLKLWERISNKGLPCGDPHSHKARLEALWVACHARDPANPLAVFERAAKGYCEAQRKRGKTPRLQWFAQDFEGYADVSNGRNGKSSPLIEELKRTRAAYEKAKASSDAEGEARLGLELQRIGKRMTGHA